MRHRAFDRLRALILLAAFSIGLAGQAVAFAPMAMAQDDGRSVTAAMDGGNHCPGCAGGDAASSKALMPACAVAFCSLAFNLAILPEGLAIASLRDGSFTRVIADRAQGMSIRPDLGPPRTNHHT
jgi:hypothetical protein